MTATHAEQIIDGYLRQLETELRGVSASRREELVAEIRAHIEDARSGLVEETDLDIRNLLDRLGSPASIAAADRGGDGGQARRIDRFWARLLVGSLVAIVAGLALEFLVLRVVLAPSSAGQEVSIDRVLGLVADGRVGDATMLSRDGRLVGRYCPEALVGGRCPTAEVGFWSVTPVSDRETTVLAQLFARSGATLRVDDQRPKSLVMFVAQYLIPVPVLISLLVAGVAFWVLLLRRGVQVVSPRVHPAPE